MSINPVQFDRIITILDTTMFVGCTLATCWLHSDWKNKAEKTRTLRGKRGFSGWHFTTMSDNVCLGLALGASWSMFESAANFYCLWWQTAAEVSSHVVSVTALFSGLPSISIGKRCHTSLIATPVGIHYSEGRGLSAHRIVYVDTECIRGRI